MDFAPQDAFLYSPECFSAYYYRYVPNTVATYTENWVTTSVNTLEQQRYLVFQKGYLEQMLSKTATTLNALRDRQTRNERLLIATPSPRSKRKKIQQNKWRTAKTIKTHENEERAIIDCLRVCQCNIDMLKAMMIPTPASSTVPDLSTSVSCLGTDSATTDVDWNNGWVDDGETSPFQRKPRRPIILDDIAPETPLDENGPELGNTAVIGPPQLRSRLEQAVPPPPPNPARSRQCFSYLSATAKSFQLGGADETFQSGGCTKRPDKKLDRLSIDGMLTSKRVRRLQSGEQERLSDTDVSYICRSLSSASIGLSNDAPRRSASCCGASRKGKDGGPVQPAADEELRRSISS